MNGSVAAVRGSRCSRLSVVVAAAVVSTAACDGPPPVIDSEIRPGDSLLDVLHRGRVVRYPVSNLPAAVRELAAAPFRMRSAPIDPRAWIPAGTPPDRLRNGLGEHVARFWRARPEIHRMDDAVEIWIDGERHRSWDPETEPFPGEVVLWDPATESLKVLCDQPSRNITVEYSADPVREFGPLERRLGGTAIPQIESLLVRQQLDEVTRPALLAPAGTRLDFSIDALAGDELCLSLGIVAAGYGRVEDRLERREAGSDGVEFVVRVTAGGDSAEVFREWLGRDRVGATYSDFRVDIGKYLGRAVELSFETLPGSAGNAEFDYGLWSDLRLLGDPVWRPDQPHVVILDLDTLRADRLGCYGHDRETSPRLDRWAAEHAMVYRDAMSTAGWTLPSTASMLTGLAVHQHGVERYPAALSPRTPTLASVLSERGYETRSWNEGSYVKADFGFDLGFDCYDGRRAKHLDWSPALEWLRARRSERPFFLFLHTYLVHAPYPYSERFEDPDRGPLAGETIGYRDTIHPLRRGELELDEASRQYISRLYDARVRELDDLVGAFLEAVEQLFEDEEILIIVTSDHGDEFFEHGGLDHGHSLYQELLHVPLIVRYPGGAPRGIDRRVASSLDIVPTIFEVLCIDVPDYMPGRSLLGEPDDRRALVAQHHGALYAVRVGPYKLLRDSGRSSDPEPTRLFDLGSDPREQTNLAGRRPELVSRLEAELDRYIEHYSPREDFAIEARLGAREIDELRELGYLVEESDPEHPPDDPHEGAE
jgi:arylsulfatase A-like enzyme